MSIDPNWEVTEEIALYLRRSQPPTVANGTHVRVQPVLVRTTNAREHPINISDSASTNINRWAGLADMVIEAYVHPGYSTAPSGSICWMDAYSIDPAQVRRMYYVAEKLTKGLDRLERKFGTPKSFGIYVTQIASIIGARRMFIPHIGRWSSYSDIGWDIIDAATIFSAVDMEADHALEICLDRQKASA